MYSIQCHDHYTEELTRVDVQQKCDILIKRSVSAGRNILSQKSCELSRREGNLNKDTAWQREDGPRHTSRQNGDMNLRCNSEKKRLEEDNGLISQKLTVRPA